MENPDIPEVILLMGLHEVARETGTGPLTSNEAKEKVDSGDGRYERVKHVAIHTNLRKAWIDTRCFDLIHGEGMFQRGVELAEAIMKSCRLQQT